MITVAISFAIAVTFFYALLLLWRDFWVDEVREDLFALRDRLFMYAAESELIQHDSYLILRERINLMIRYAHELSLPRLLGLMIAHAFLRPSDPPGFAQLTAAFNSLPRAQCEAMHGMYADMAMLIGRQIYKTSVVLRVVVLVAGVVFSLTRGNADKAREEIVEHVPTRLLEADALDCAA